MEIPRLAILAFILWLLAILLFMILAVHFDTHLFFTLALLGLLVMAELVEPAFVKPRYALLMRRVIAAGVILFGIIVAGKVVEILGS